MMTPEGEQRILEILEVLKDIRTAVWAITYIMGGYGLVLLGGISAAVGAYMMGYLSPW